jgi:hypothetical protein
MGGAGKRQVDQGLILAAILSPAQTLASFWLFALVFNKQTSKHWAVIKLG